MIRLAILDPLFQITDLLSLAICGYIGGRFVFLRTTEFHLKKDSLSYYAVGVGTALITSFGGGSFYALIMKHAPRSFAFFDPLNVVAVLFGYALSLFCMRHCLEGTPFAEFVPAPCEEVFRLFDCTNCAILVAWGASKSITDTVDLGVLGTCFWALSATYTYSFGGGIARDLIAMVVGATDRIGNFDVPSVVALAMVGILVYLMLLVLRLPKLLEVGLGLPAVFLIFSRMPALMSR